MAVVDRRGGEQRGKEGIVDGREGMETGDLWRCSSHRTWSFMTASLGAFSFRLPRLKFPCAVSWSTGSMTEHQMAAVVDASLPPTNGRMLSSPRERWCDRILDMTWLFGEPELTCGIRPSEVLDVQS